QPVADAAHECVVQHDVDRHGDVLQGDARRGAPVDDAQVEPLRDRARDHGEDLQAGLPRLRDSDYLRRPWLRRRQEDHVARRRRRDLDLDQVPVHRVKSDLLKRLFSYTRPYRGRMTLAVIAMFVYAAGDAGQAYLIKPIVDKTLAFGTDLT